MSTPAVNPPPYNVGDWFQDTNGSTWIFEKMLGPRKDGTLGLTFKFVEYKAKQLIPEGKKIGKFLHTPPAGLFKAAWGLPVDQITVADAVASEEWNDFSQTLGKGNYDVPAADGKSLRYPMPGLSLIHI